MVGHDSLPICFTGSRGPWTERGPKKDAKDTVKTDTVHAVHAVHIKINRDANKKNAVRACVAEVLFLQWAQLNIPLWGGMEKCADCVDRVDRIGFFRLFCALCGPFAVHGPGSHRQGIVVGLLSVVAFFFVGSWFAGDSFAGYGVAE